MRLHPTVYRTSVLWLACVALWSACGDATKPDTTPAEVAITVVDTLRSIGATTNLTAAVKNASHETIAGVVATDWQSSDPGILTVSSTGLGTAVANGSVTVTAHAGTVSGSVAVVVWQRVAAVTVTGGNVIGSLGSHVQLAASAADALGVPITGRAIQWSSSEPTVASVDPVSGLVTATGAGTVTLRARIDSVTANHTLTVAQVPASLTLTAPTDTLRSLTATGQFTAVVKDSGGSTIAAPVVQWTSTNPAVVTISGAQGLATAVSNGAVFVRVQAGTVRDSLPLVVRQRVDVSKSSLTIARAQLFVHDTVRATLQARDALNNAIAFGGATVVFSSMGSAGVASTVTFHATVDRGSGTYTGDFVGTAMGANTIVTATIDGAPIPSSPTFRVVGFTRIAVSGATIVDATSTTTGGHSCGILTTGEMYCWGMSLFGIRGNGTAGISGPDPIPTLVGGNQQWTEVATGITFVCAVAAGGAAYCWGDGDLGEIGNGASGNPPDVRTPTPVSGSNSFAAVSIGFSQGACGVTLASAALCWGAGTFGRLGNGSEALSAVPVTVSGGLSFAAAATSYAGTCGIAAGSAYCWGHYYVLGGGGAPAPDMCAVANPCALTPVAVSGGHTFRPIITRDANVACAVSDDDKTYCWGSGYLGNGSQGFTTAPVFVSGGLTFTSLAAGDAAYCGIVAGGAAYCWGDGRNGRLGNNSTSTAYVPGPVSGGHAFTQLSLSQDHACGVATDGNAYCWGGNDKGELGTRTLVASLVPVRVRLFPP